MKSSEFAGSSLQLNQLQNVLLYNLCNTLTSYARHDVLYQSFSS